MSGEALTQEQIAREIIGKDITAKRKGVSVRLKYLPDGNVTMKAMLIPHFPSKALISLS
jgi:hypothetical protein